MRRSYLSLSLSPLALLCLAGCASGPKANPGPPISEWEALFPEIVDPMRKTDGPRGFFRARPPSQEQRRALDAAIKVYVDGDDEGFAQQRDALAADPVTGFWLTRTLMLFVIAAREAKAGGKTSAMVAEPVWERPIRHIEGLGAAAVPAVVVDLLRAKRSDRVKLGRELLERIGPVGFGRWVGALRLDDSRSRRKLLEVVAGWEEHDNAMIAVLSEASRDEDFGVRAVGYQGLARSGAADPQVFQALRDDDDGFVRRKIIEGLGGREASRAPAAALIEVMAQAVEKGDNRTVFMVDDALRRMSGRKERGTLSAWRAWLSTLRSVDAG